MAWTEIYGNERIKKILQRSLIEKRLAGAYCLWGKEGIGKETIALEFAKAANCMNPISTNNSFESCGICPSCLKAAKLQHPNILFIFSLPAGKTSDTRSDGPLAKLSDDQMQSIQEQLAEKAENPYHKIHIPNATQIKVSSIREIKKNLSLTASQGGWRFVIISHADEMNIESANAFLKTIEEPNDRATIILTTSKKEALPDTILSRCQLLNCQSIPDDTIVNILKSKHSIEEQEARLVAAFAQGSYHSALEYLNSDMKILRVEIINIFRTSLKKRLFRVELIEQIESMKKQYDKLSIESALTLLLIWLRDSYILLQTKTDKGIINKDQLDTIMNFTRNFGTCNIEAAISACEKALNGIRRNFDLYLIILTLFISLRKIFIEKMV